MGPRIVVVGGGFAGLRALAGLRTRLAGGAELTLVDRLSATLAQAPTPLEEILRDAGGVFLHGIVDRVDAQRREVLLEDGRFLGFDRVLLALGNGALEGGHTLPLRSGLGDPRGLIPTDEAMRHLEHTNVYAAGDCAAPRSNSRGLDALLQADIAAASIVRDSVGVAHA